MQATNHANLFFFLSLPSNRRNFQMENQIIVNDYRQMDKILKEERQYLLNMVKKIKKAKCNVLLVQKSILRDAVTDLSLHFLAKLNILVIKDIERDEVEFICKVNFSPPSFLHLLSLPFSLTGSLFFSF
jgi:chaperonin GroEL (HSP60 family)